MRFFVSNKELNKMVSKEVSEVLRKQAQKDAKELARQEKIDKAKKNIEDQCKEMSRFRKAGGTFLYLNITFVVIEINTRAGNMVHGHFVPGTAFFTCEYVGPDGKIAKRNFNYDMLKVLNKAAGK